MRKVEVSEIIRVAAPKIIQAFTDYGMLKDWWDVGMVLIETKPGGIYMLAWGITDKGFQYVSSGIIKEYDPESHLIIEKLVYLNPQKPFLGPMTLSVHAKGKDGASQINISQEGYGEGADWDWYYEAVKLAWPVVIQSLKNYLEKGI